MTRSKVLGALIGFALPLGWAGSSAAAGFGDGLQLVVSGERLFGIVSASQETTRTVANVETKTTTRYTSVNLLTSHLNVLTTNYALPRVGFDLFVIDGLSVGTGFGLFSASGEVENEAQGQSQTQDSTSYSGYVLAPRVGYAFMLIPWLGLWPRAGVTLQHLGSESGSGNSESSTNRTAVTLEVPVVITPVAHAGFSIGPILDLGLGGSVETSSTDPDTGITTTSKGDLVGTDIGIQAGLLVYF